MVDWVFAIAVVAIAVVRFVILRDGGAPATIDAGNWLAFGDALFGAETRSSTIVYPPVVPLLTKGFVEAFGMATGVAALGAVDSVAPAVGFYVAVRRCGLAVEALPGALLLLGASAVGEATAWGGIPQLFGLGLMSLGLFQFDRWISSGRSFDAALTGLLAMAMLATTHFIGLAFCVAGLVVLAFGIPRLRRHQRAWTAWAGDTLLIVIPAMWLIPLYVGLFGASFGGTESFRFLNQLTGENLIERVEFLYRDFPALWRIVLPITLVTPLVLWRRRSSPVWRVLVAVLVSSAGLAWVTRESRFLYLATLAAALASVLWFQAVQGVLQGRSEPRPAAARRRWGRSVVALVITGVLAWQLIGGLVFFREQREFYGVLTPGLFEGLEAVRDDTASDATVAVAWVRDAPVGWWVEAITGRETYYATALRWLTFDDELERARIGNQIFSQSFPDEQSLEVARTRGVDYLIVPTQWARMDVDRIGPTSAFAPAIWLANDDVVILQMAQLAGE